MPIKTHMKLVLESFKHITNTLGNVIPVVGLLKEISDFHQNHNPGYMVQAIVSRLEEQIANHLEPQLVNHLHNVATFCEPRVKGSIARRSSALDILKQKLIGKV